MQKKTEPQNENEKNPEAGNVPETDEAAKTAETPEAVTEAVEAEADPGQRLETLEALKAEVADLRDKLLRAMAETENVRRRAERDKNDASKYAITAFARDMVGVSDNLKRAIESAAGDSGEENASVEIGKENKDVGTKLKNLLEGVEMTEREMINALERAGVTPIEAQGRPFDHNYHDAMFETEDPSLPAGTVLQVLQVGYRIGERLLRPAKVSVAKGGPKVAAKATSEDAAGEGEGSEQTPGQTPGQTKAYEKGSKTSGGQVDEEL